MKKEVMLAIGLGAVLGLLIAFGIYNANQAIKNTKKQIEAKKINASASPNQTEFPLLINQPENNLVFDTNEATISGKTEPEATVAVMAENDQDLLTSDNQGLFSTVVNLVSGLNEIKITVLNKNGQQQEKTLNLFYSTAKIE